MATLKQYYLNHAGSLLPVLHRKVLSRLRKRNAFRVQKPNDFAQETRTAPEHSRITHTYASLDGWAADEQQKKIFSRLAECYCAHKFDVLGSGWVNWSFETKPSGIEQYTYDSAVAGLQIDAEGSWLDGLQLPAHTGYSKKLWQSVQQLNSNYKPIDWQRDLKSGFRWSEQVWYQDIAGFHSGKPGADVKVPWELARMHHLPRLALAAQCLPERQEQLAKEFQCQVFDFIASNPVRMGVNWAMTMDVGIRVANMLMAYDLFAELQDGALLSEAFRTTFAASVYDHGNHIFNNLEKKEGLAGNHYLANLAGLVFAGAYLDSTKETDEWLKFGWHEFSHQMERQFFSDGCNFEASTAYHCLGTDLVVWPSAILVALARTKPGVVPPTIAPHWADKLGRAGDVFWDITKPNGNIPQVGDNDSGRLFFLHPTGHFNAQGTWQEQLLDYRPVAEAVDALFATDKTAEQAMSCRSIIGSIAGTTELSYRKAEFVDSRFQLHNRAIFDRYKHREETLLEFDRGSAMPLNRKISGWNVKGLGLYVLQSDAGFHMTVVVGAPEDQMYHWSHVHNDKGSFDLNIDGKDVFVDPGSYVYGSMPEWRNRFRGAEAHNGIVVEGVEQNRWVPDQSVFLVLKDSQCQVLEFTGRSLVLRIQYQGVDHIRKFEVLDNAVKITDFCNRPFRVNLNRGELYSPGYGKRTTIA